MEPSVSSIKSIGLVQKWGGSATVLPRQRRTRVRISVILMERSRNSISPPSSKAARREWQRELSQTQRCGGCLLYQKPCHNRNRGPAGTRRAVRKQSRPWLLRNQPIPQLNRQHLGEKDLRVEPSRESTRTAVRSMPGRKA